MASPYAYIEYFGVSTHAYGWLFALNNGGVIVMTLLNARLVVSARCGCWAWAISSGWWCCM
ncbi:hypothetical protein MXM82_16845 [Pseudomonas asiatica]|uniref:hypothetical protein n=1 Tax=Pseudomonas TaxID=286 RepID=UPI00128BD901|nr:MULTISPECIES: hypothetical protein [Pseudomonas]MEB6590787.1 hypothetical protein [Pseudomonas asiatica]